MVNALNGGGPKASENTLNSFLTECDNDVFWQIGADMDSLILVPGGPDEILAVVTTTSCFAPRAADDVPAVAEICGRLAVPHVVNNAYG